MKPHKGFGLLEILITLVLLGVGVAGLVAMSRSLLNTSQDSRRYEVAMRLAESKLDAFRTFNGVVSAVSPLTAYNSIAAGSSSATPPDGGGTYALTWSVSNQYWNGSAWQTAIPAGYLRAYPGRKVVNVTVSWSDSVGQSHSLLLSGAVSPVESLTQNQFNGGLDTSREPPHVVYTPGVAPDVISIQIDQEGRKQETSKPLPTVTSKDGTVGKLVQFETVTYKPDNGGNTQQVLQDLASVSCSCSYGSSVNAYLPGKAILTSSNLLYWNVGSQVTKQTGVLNSSVRDQPSLCTSCCKDHFDGSGSSFEQFYAPLNTSRLRYNSGLSSVNSGDYVDACRFVRLDGYYRPLPDWNLIKVIVTSADFLAKPANQTSYQNYIKYVVTTYITWQKNILNWTANPTATAPTITEFADWLPANAATGGDTSTKITMNTGTAQLIARGIYVDLLSPDSLAKLDLTSQDLLAKVPFQDINLTMLAEWSLVPLSGQLTGSASDYVGVTNEPVKTVVDLGSYYFGSYSRGYLSAKKSTKDASNVLQSASIKVTAYQGNSGITASLISPVDRSEAKVATMPISVDTSSQTVPTLTVSGRIECLEKVSNRDSSPTACNKNTFNGLNPPTTTTSGATCRIDKPQANNQPATYVCTAPQNSTLVISFSYSAQGNTAYLLKPASLSIAMTPPANGQVISGPCALLVDNGVTNATNLSCTP
ncbi:prepilin-type N-terminal cleavage/methylation domain-containing protein [Aeromonas sp. FDAARGOS 1405]|uniref:type IV pilus modification PilV family protein n=1 Tax=unclassified Aeromonas TaxID=257493 RepID=UPI001C23FFA4|nr:prepilin-type N-terminal cleavage/methylation domain-containing protein [Aeromonas sp. FDAARGOS 1405]QXB31297.1 prepilin-type N-terminal cleavage/methylation domain-containing protein [Aeromonas sp. FDAARGOS 1405]